MTDRPRAVLLDFYGTVVAEDDALIAAICEEIAAGTGCAAPDVAAAWAESFSRECAASSGAAFRTQRAIERSSLTEVLARFGHQTDVDERCRQLFAHWRKPPLYRDARTFLDAVDLPICVVSNIDRGDLEAALAHHGLAPDFVVTSEDVRAYKPRPEPFTAALRLLGEPADGVLHVGDSLSGDVAGAIALGIPVAWVNRRRRPLPAGQVVRHDVADLTALAELLGCTA